MRLLIIIGSLLFTFRLAAQLSLEECHEKAALNYPLIKQIELIEKSKEYTLSNANKAYLPQISITGIGGIIDGFPQIAVPDDQNSGNSDFNLISILQINQTIWDGGMTKAGKGILEANADLEKADVTISIYAIKERVNNIYFGILLIDEKKKQTELFKSSLNENLKKLELLYSNGILQKSDVDELKVELLNTQQTLSELEYNRMAYLNILSLFIGEKLDENIELIIPLTEADLNEGEINRPELVLFDIQERRIESLKKMDRAKVYPKIGLMGLGTFIQPGIAFGRDEMNRIIVAGLSLSWEFGSLYSISNNKKINSIGLEKIANQKETFLFSTNLQLSQIKTEIEKYKSLIEQDRKMILLKSDILEAYQSKFENGICTTAELLNKINDENMAKQNLVLHEIQYVMFIYQYRTISGN